MRSSPSNFEFVAPKTLEAVLALMASEPGRWTPVAGGTEVMVQFGAGRLAADRLVSIRGIAELKGIHAKEDTVQIGAGCTYSDLRKDRTIAEEFPLLSSAASWTGSIGNQNRGTLGGNIVNASPAADSLPALLVYDAKLILISANGERCVRYNDFHTGYKQTLLAPNELIRTILLPRRYRNWLNSAQKVGPRNAQAISKLCMAAAAKLSGKYIEEIRVAFGSMAATPIRLRRVENLLAGKLLSDTLIEEARRLFPSEVSPIDDIRSTRIYRTAVAWNLLEQFLRGLMTDGNLTLARWNFRSQSDAANEILSCCGSRAWAESMAAARPFASEEEVFSRAARLWHDLTEDDWLEAFRSHPRIGERHAEHTTTQISARWSTSEQSGVAQSGDELKQSIAEGNRRYEERFGRIFIICAAGKAPEDILAALRRRLGNDVDEEISEAAEQQEEIMQLRLRKWLQTEVRE